MNHVIFFSGGVASWATAKRVAETHGSNSVVMLFTDTLIEDADLYRFLDEAAANVGGRLVKISEGRTPWEVFFQSRMLGNSRSDPCSRILKRELAHKWIESNYPDPSSVTLYLGYLWEDAHRVARSKAAWLPYTVRCPLLDKPILSRVQIFDWLASEGIKRPALYDEGFEHNNCGGACIKGGQGHWIHLLKTRPCTYAEWETKEQEFREYVGKDVSILRDRSGGEFHPLTLKILRERYEADGQLDLSEIGGCGCFSE